MQVVQPKPTIPKPSASRSVEQAAAPQIVRGCRRAGCQRGLHPWRGREPALVRLPGQEPGGDQHLRVGGVGAAGDRGDRDRTVTGACGTIRPVSSRIRARVPADVADQVVLGIRWAANGSRGQRRAQAILWPPRPGQRQLDTIEVELEDGRVARRQAPARARAPDVGHRPRSPAVDRGRDRLRADSRGPCRRAGRIPWWRHIPAPCWRWHRARRRPARATPGPKNSTNLPTTPSLRSRSRHGQRDIGAEPAGPEAAGQPHAHDLGQAQGQWQPEHGAFGLEPTDAPAEHAHGVDHRRMAVGAQERVGQHPRLAVDRLERHDRRQVLQVDGVHDAGARREHLEPAEIARCPFHEPVALGIAADLDAHVAQEGTALAELVDADRVVGGGRHRTDRAQRRGVAAVLGDHVAHGGDIDQGRAAGRVVHQNAARPERDLDLGTGAGEPHDRIQGGLGRIRLARPQGILEQDPQAPRQRRESVTCGSAQIDEPVRPSRKGEHGRKTRRCSG